MHKNIDKTDFFSAGNSNKYTKYLTLFLDILQTLPKYIII